MIGFVGYLMDKNNIKKISFLSIFWRALIAIIIVAASVLLALNMIDSRDEPPKRQARERAFTVSVIEPEIGTYRSSIDIYGEIITNSNIDVRAQVSGEIKFVSNNLVAGGVVSKGELLIAIDSFNYDGALKDANAALVDTQLQLEIGKQQLELEKVNLEIAKQQLTLGQKDLERAKSLHASGALTDKALDDKEFALSQRAQLLAQRQSSYSVQFSNIERQENSIIRAKWNLDKAQRSLENTKIYAPFNGAVINNNSAQLGRILTNNEMVAQLYATNSLEVSFIISDKQYGILSSDGLLNRSIEVIWDIEPNKITTNGTITRIDAQINAAMGGVKIFAKLNDDGLKNLRPGNFVQVKIAGISYENSYKVPETAIYESSHIFIVKNKRMQRIDIELLAYDMQSAIIRADIDKNDKIISTHLAQAGAGLKVNIEGEEEIRPNLQQRGEARQQGAMPQGQRPARKEGQRPPRPEQVNKQTAPIRGQ